jgi:hypothetical protein
MWAFPCLRRCCCCCRCCCCVCVLQLMFLMLIVGVVFNVVKGAVGGGNKTKNQDW